MQKEIAEWFAGEVERDDLPKCSERLNRYQQMAAEAFGREREKLLQLAEVAELELMQWISLVSIARESGE